MKPIQSRMARAALELGLRKVAADLNMSTATVTRFEKGGDTRVSTLTALMDYYSDLGITFIDADEHGGVGVRLIK